MSLAAAARSKESLAFLSCIAGHKKRARQLVRVIQKIYCLPRKSIAKLAGLIRDWLCAEESLRDLSRAVASLMNAPSCPTAALVFPRSIVPVAAISFTDRELASPLRR